MGNWATNASPQTDSAQLIAPLRVAALAWFETGADIERLIDGFQFHPAALSREQQEALAQAVMALAQDTPFYSPTVPGGRRMSVAITGLGPLSWTSDAAGYGYVASHPATGRPWPSMPPILVGLWRRLAPGAPDPDACLVNLYRGGARMGLHQDRDEQDFSVPVLSISLGDSAMFRIGGLKRSDPTRSLKLSSGDVCLLTGPARLAFHGIDRVTQGSSTVVPGGGRLNLTLRRAR
jgi:alkylated DNA repair protein (DNA oxidative demethylase)